MLFAIELARQLIWDRSYHWIETLLERSKGARERRIFLVLLIFRTICTFELTLQWCFYLISTWNVFFPVMPWRRDFMLPYSHHLCSEKKCMASNFFQALALVSENLGAFNNHKRPSGYVWPLTKKLIVLTCFVLNVILKSTHPFWLTCFLSWFFSLDNFTL